MTKFQMMILFLLLAVGTPHSVSSQQQLPRQKSNKPGLVGDLRVGVPAWPVDADEGRPQLVIRQEEDGWFRFLQTSLRETPAQSIGVACEPNLEPVTKIIAPAASDPPPNFPESFRNGMALPDSILKWTANPCLWLPRKHQLQDVHGSGTGNFSDTSPIRILHS